MSRLAAVVAGLLLVVGVLPGAGPDLLVVALAVVAAAALGLAARPLALAPLAHVRAPARGHDSAPRRRLLTTDPTHHPLAPRAPGPA